MEKNIMRLINEKCHDGVAYQLVKNLKIESFWVMPKTPNFTNEGIPYITSKNIKNGNISFDNVKYIEKDDYDLMSKNRKIMKNDILITMIGTIGEVAIVRENKDFYGQNFYLLRLNNNMILNKYFYYYFTKPTTIEKLLSKKMLSNQGYIKANNIENLAIPLPPLEVQEAIANVLDKFEELEKELEKELEMRKDQYEYYRNRLLTFDDSVECKKLEEVLKYEQPSKYIVKNTKYNDEYKTPVLTAGQTFILGYTNEEEGVYKANKEKPCIIFDDFTTSFHWVDFDFKVKSSAMKILTPVNNLVCFKYLFFAMQCVDFEPSTHTRHWISKYSQFEIPLPPLEVQQKIVDTLDQFETLCTSLTEGLPAEINLLRDLYEYYRNKLLDFKDIENIENTNIS